MRFAAISDIHGNLEALDAVLADIRRQGVDEIVCLGDIVGFGPNPCECVDRVMEACPVTLLGDHDWPIPSPSRSRGDQTDRAALWTHEQLDPSRDRVNNIRRRAFLIARPSSHRAGAYLFVHGSPRNPLSEFVFPEDIYNHRKMERLFSLVDRYCIKGHTHVPGIFTDDGHFLTPVEVGDGYPLGTGKRMIDVGSVGQPRDGDDRACYAIFDGPDDPNRTDPPGDRAEPRVTFRRVPYELETTLRKIRDIGH